MKIETKTEFNKLGIINYALGKQDGKYFLNIIRAKEQPKLFSFPLLKDKNNREISEELYNELFNEVKL